VSFRRRETREGSDDPENAYPEDRCVFVRSENVLDVEVRHSERERTLALYRQAELTGSSPVPPIMAHRREA
jgi:hypothetical protein